MIRSSQFTKIKRTAPHSRWDDVEPAGEREATTGPVGGDAGRSSCLSLTIGVATAHRGDRGRGGARGSRRLGVGFTATYLPAPARLQPPRPRVLRRWNSTFLPFTRRGSSPRSRRTAAEQARRRSVAHGSWAQLKMGRSI